jgi:hypothetical protein
MIERRMLRWKRRMKGKSDVLNRGKKKWDDMRMVNGPKKETKSLRRNKCRTWMDYGDTVAKLEMMTKANWDDNH